LALRVLMSAHNPEEAPRVPTLDLDLELAVAAAAAERDSDSAFVVRSSHTHSRPTRASSPSPFRHGGGGGMPATLSRGLMSKKRQMFMCLMTVAICVTAAIVIPKVRAFP
jgi:hypothetical protein